MMKELLPLGAFKLRWVVVGGKPKHKRATPKMSVHAWVYGIESHMVAGTATIVETDGTQYNAEYHSYADLFYDYDLLNKSYIKKINKEEKTHCSSSEESPA